MQTQSNVDQVLESVFGDNFAALPKRGKAALDIDIRAIQEEEECSSLDAATLLRRRIGGVHSLESYARCIVITYQDQLGPVAS